jgi:hypothetical protein
MLEDQDIARVVEDLYLCAKAQSPVFPAFFAPLI